MQISQALPFTSQHHPVPIKTHSTIPKPLKFSLINPKVKPTPPPLPFINPEKAYGPVLDTCATNKVLLYGKQIHAHLVKSNWVSQSVFLCTKLVHLYGKCGCVSDAEKLFDEMPERTVFTWNALIGTYVTNGDCFRAIEVYKELRSSFTIVDSCTIASVLKACSVVEDFRSGSEVHGLAIKCGFGSVGFVANSLVSMYAKCNDIDAVRKSFDRMDDRDDVVSWNSVISAYSGGGRWLEAFRLFREMQDFGVVPNSFTFVAVLQACDSDSGKVGMEIHAAILKSSWFVDVYVANALLAMYVRLGKMVGAGRVFDNMDVKDNVTWNSLLSGFIQNGIYDKALEFYYNMRDAGLRPDLVSLISIATACGRLGYLLRGKELHAYAIKNGFDSNFQVGNTLIDMYAKCYCMNYSLRVFDNMPDKDLVTWTTIIAGYAQNNCHEEALEVLRQFQFEGIDLDATIFGSILQVCNGSNWLSQVKEVHGYIIRHELADPMLRNSVLGAYGDCGDINYARRVFASIECKDVVCWTSMVSSLSRNGFVNEALAVFCSMRESDIEPDSITLISVLSAVSSLSTLKKGKEIHGFIIRKAIILEGPLANSLVDMYACCGNLEQAYRLYVSVNSKSLVLWTTMINAYGMHGKGVAAIKLFNRMEDEKVIPDHITFLTLIYSCSHSGLVQEGKRIFEIMKCKYGIEPWPEHYACLVDLMCRANCLEEAYQFVQSMKTQPTAEVWCAFLCGCRAHSNKALGKIAVKKLMELEPENPGNYVLISNVFAASGRWQAVDDIRMRMRGTGLKKNPGCSWIEIGNKVHTFVARDKSHPESHKIYEKLAQITEKLEREGSYVAQTELVLHNAGQEEKIQMLYAHSERLAIAYGLLLTPHGTPLRIAKNLRVCSDCHTYCKLVSKFFERDLIIRDASRFHHFSGGVCSCRDFW